MGVPDSSEPAHGQEMTIDELARAADIPVSTIRMYQHRGVLAAPVRRGRVGYYGGRHLQRLRLIADLQHRGYSLAAIKETVEALAQGHTVADLVGFDTSSSSREPLRLDMGELAERFNGVSLTADDITEAVQLGLIEIEGTEVIVHDKVMLDVGSQVATLGVPISVILVESQRLKASVDEIAQRFKDVFEEYRWQRFADAGMPADEVVPLVAEARLLSQLAVTVVVRQMQERFRDFVDEYAERAAHN